MSILTRNGARVNLRNSLGDFFRAASTRPLLALRDRLKIVPNWGAPRRPQGNLLVPASTCEQVEQGILATLGIDDLIAMEIPERELLLDPILPARGLIMIHARRGGSKTFLALAIGLAVAGGTNVLRWSAPKARRVLYVDGEMALVDLQRRVAALKAGIGVNIRNDHFRLLAARPHRRSRPRHRIWSTSARSAARRSRPPDRRQHIELSVGRAATMMRARGPRCRNEFCDYGGAASLCRRLVRESTSGLGHSSWSIQDCLPFPQDQVQSNESCLSRSYRSHLAFGTCSSTTFVSISNGTARRCSSST
jgi:AAA domain